MNTLRPERALRCTRGDALHLIILPTEACNFRCVYCYEDFRYKRMEPWVVSAIKALLTQRAPDLIGLTLSWFGGEPLLAHDVIEDVMSHVLDLRASNLRLRVDSDATTNGSLLTPERARRLVELGVSRYQISFDGPKRHHDSKRVLAGGRGTFDRIWENLLRLRDLEENFLITIRVHVDRDNMQIVPEFIDECAGAFGGDPRFEMFIRALSRLGGANDDNLDVMEKDEGDAILRGLRAYAGDRGLPLASSSPEDAICYASRANSFVIRADGRLNKCTVSLAHSNNYVGRIRENGSLEVDAVKMVEWTRGLWSGDAAELKCPMKGYADPVKRAADPIALSVR